MIRKLAAAGAMVTGVVDLVAGPAFAHVEIGRDGQVGADGIVATTLHVPNEEANAGTVRAQLVFPATPVLDTATAGALDGWTATVQKGPADVKTIRFKALQTYDNDTVVRWIEVTPAGGAEPEHPAPVLTARGVQPTEGGAAAKTDPHPASSSSDGGLSTGAIVVGVVIVLALLGYVLSRTRRNTGSRTD
jgi:uncharacterized protein YcnI